MRKLFGGLMLALGGFLLVAAVLGTFWAPGVVKKTPTDVNTTTTLVGEAAKLDTATGEFVSRPIYAVSVSKVDSDTSTDDTAVWVSTSCAVFDTGGERVCLDGSDPDLITAAIDTFATDRTSGLAVSDDALPADSVPHEGLVNKFPFGSQKKTYPYWDGTVGKAVDAEYTGTETLDGVETYVYEVTIDDAPIEIAEGIDGTYFDKKTIYVEPKTGAIQNQKDEQQRFLDDGTQVLELQLEFSDEQKATFADDAKTNIASLGLLTRTIPIVGFVGGFVLIALGTVLLYRRRRPDQPVPVVKEPVHAGR